MAASVTADDRHILQTEINHLLNFIEQSTCSFLRNGESHNPEKAVAHIKKKYKHFKNKITSAEDFVKYSATGSLISKKPYYIKCPDMHSQEKSAQWLLAELARFRAARDSSVSDKP